MLVEVLPRPGCRAQKLNSDMRIKHMFLQDSGDESTSRDRAVCDVRLEKGAHLGMGSLQHLLTVQQAFLSS